MRGKNGTPVRLEIWVYNTVVWLRLPHPKHWIFWAEVPFLSIKILAFSRIVHSTCINFKQFDFPLRFKCMFWFCKLHCISGFLGPACQLTCLMLHHRQMNLAHCHRSIKTSVGIRHQYLAYRLITLFPHICTAIFALPVEDTTLQNEFSLLSTFKKYVWEALGHHELSLVVYLSQVMLIELLEVRLMFQMNLVSRKQQLWGKAPIHNAQRHFEKKDIVFWQVSFLLSWWPLEWTLNCTIKVLWHYNLCKCLLPQYTHWLERCW